MSASTCYSRLMARFDEYDFDVVDAYAVGLKSSCLTFGFTVAGGVQATSSTPTS